MQPIRKEHFDRLFDELQNTNEADSIISFEENKDGLVRPILKSTTSEEIWWFFRWKPKNERAKEVGNLLETFFTKNVTPETKETRGAILLLLKDKLTSRSEKTRDKDKLNKLIEKVNEIIKMVNAGPLYSEPSTSTEESLATASVEPVQPALQAITLATAIPARNAAPLTPPAFERARKASAEPHPKQARFPEPPWAPEVPISKNRLFANRNQIQIRKSKKRK